MYKKFEHDGKVTIFNLLEDPVEQQNCAGAWITFNRFVGELDLHSKFEIGKERWGAIIGYATLSKLKDATEEEFLDELEKEFSRIKELAKSEDSFRIYYGFPRSINKAIRRALHAK